MIHIIDTLFLNNGSLQCKDKDGKWGDIALIQGTIDGACAIYSMMMDLLLLKAIRHSDIQLYSTPSEASVRKLFSALLEQNGMHMNGETFTWMKKRLIESMGSSVTCIHKLKFDINLISDSLDDNKPVIISVGGKNWSHAMLSIGYEKHDEVVTKLFCLDPSGDKPKYSYWNSYLDLDYETKNRKYKYSYTNDSSSIMVELDDYMLISKVN